MCGSTEAKHILGQDTPLEKQSHMQQHLIRNDMLSLESLLHLHFCTVGEDEKLLFSAANPPTNPTCSHTTSLHFLQVMAQGGRKSGSVASYMGLARERRRRTEGSEEACLISWQAVVLETEQVGAHHLPLQPPLTPDRSHS